MEVPLADNFAVEEMTSCSKSRNRRGVRGVRGVVRGVAGVDALAVSCGACGTTTDNPTPCGHPVSLKCATASSRPLRRGDGEGW